MKQFKPFKTFMSNTEVRTFQLRTNLGGEQKVVIMTQKMYREIRKKFGAIHNKCHANLNEAEKLKIISEISYNGLSDSEMG